jgi:hypothetical protein
MGARGSIVGWGAMLQAGRPGTRSEQVIGFFNLPNPCSRIMARGLLNLWQKQVPEIFLRSKGRPTREADNLVAICEPIASAS